MSAEASISLSRADAKELLRVMETFGSEVSGGGAKIRDDLRALLRRRGRIVIISAKGSAALTLFNIGLQALAATKKRIQPASCTP